jgi:mannitol/fructose-specific phosphotransferase system IIA component
LGLSLLNTTDITKDKSFSDWLGNGVVVPHSNYYDPPEKKNINSADLCTT